MERQLCDSTHHKQSQTMIVAKLSLTVFLASFDLQTKLCCAGLMPRHPRDTTATLEITAGLHRLSQIILQQPGEMPSATSLLKEFRDIMRKEASDSLRQRALGKRIFRHAHAMYVCMYVRTYVCMYV